MEKAKRYLVIPANCMEYGRIKKMPKYGCNWAVTLENAQFIAMGLSLGIYSGAKLKRVPRIEIYESDDAGNVGKLITAIN